MSINKRMNKDGKVSYVVRYRLHGRHRAASFAKKADASAFEAQTTIAARNGSINQMDAGKGPLSEFGELWWKNHVQQNLAEATKRIYSHDWNTYVLPYLGQVPLRDITPKMIQEWRGDLERAGSRPPTVKKSMNVLQACLQHAVLYGEIPTNPGREVKKPSGKRLRDIRAVPPLQIEMIRQQLLAQGKYRDAALVSVLAYSGMRPGEALGLSWEHIKVNTIRVERSVAHGEFKETKTGRRRSVNLLAALRHDLDEWQLRSEGTSDLIFPRRATGGPWTTEGYKSWERKSFKKAAIAVGRGDASPYTLRHSFASLLIHEGRSPVYVARQLGHAPSMTLDTYAHLYDDLGEAEFLPAAEMIEQARLQVSRVQEKSGDDS